MRLANTSIALLAAVVWSGCNSNPSSTVGEMLTSVSATVSTATNGDLWAEVSMNLSLTQYGIAELNIPVIDPKNPAIEYGTVNITPIVCSGAATTCAAGGTLSLSIDLTTVLSVDPTSTELPNGTAFPIEFSSTATQLIAIPVGNGGAKIYIAIGGGTYFVGAAIPFAGLNGAGAYVPGADIFATVSFDNIVGYVGVFAGSGNDQTGVAAFADLSKLVPSAAPKPVLAAAELVATPRLTKAAATPAPASTALKASSTSQSRQQTFLYRLWKLGNEEHPTLRYEQ